MEFPPEESGDFIPEGMFSGAYGDIKLTEEQNERTRCLHACDMVCNTKPIAIMRCRSCLFACV